ncbi:hypothetical protein ACLB2K_009162 [Fragaria x ananassa]
MGSHSKLKVGGDGEDKISQLPDGVLSHVLSFLPTKHAVRTSILSTRWKNIWASVHCLDLEHYYCDERRSRHAGFVSSIDRVLYCESSDIQRFRLHYYCLSEDLSRIDGWIRTAIRRNVVELDLCVRLQGDNVEKIELPKTIFLCKTLVVLKLNLKSNCFIYAPPESGCFPNLKVLHIGVDCPDKDFMEKLFTFFPLLEDLTIDGYLSSAISGTFKLFVPELKRLSIEVDSNMSYEDPYEYYFSINAPKLEFLNLKVYLLPSIIFDNAMSPVKAVVNFDHHDSIEHEHYWDSATTILAAISNVQHLSLSVHTLDASCIPDFDNLIHLKLVLHDCHHWEVLAELLHRTPNLERLVLEHNEDVYCDSEREGNSDDERYLANNANSENEETSDDEDYSEITPSLNDYQDMYCKPNREVDSDKERYLADKANSEDKENSENEETSEDELNSEHFSKDVMKHNEDMYCKSDREVDSDKERYLADKANSEDKENSENEETSEDELYSEHFSKDVVKHNEDVCCNSDCEVSDEERYLADKADLEDTENSESEETSEDEEYSDHPYSEDEEYSEEYWEHPWWQHEKSAPVCLLSHLKTIVLKGFRGRRGEKEVAKYLLKNGKVLKKMTIYTGKFIYSKEEFSRDCALFCKGSKTCQVKFI